MRRTLPIGLIALAVVTVPGPDTASASCVGPMLQIGTAPRPAVVRDAPLTVEGQYFTEGCGDAIGVSEGTGCSGPQVQRDPVAPMTDITLSIRQRGHVWRLGTADAGTAKDDRLGQVTWTVTLPRGLESGPARLVADRAAPLRIVVRR